MTTRTVTEIIAGFATSDGAGVKLLRSLGQRQHSRLDPFLMLDEFSTDDPNDYIAGFPAHPHSPKLKSAVNEIARSRQMSKRPEPIAK